MADSIIKAAPLVTAAATAIGSVASARAASKAPKTEKAPALAPVAVAPTQDDAAIALARRQAIARRQSASGRQSTNLSDDDRLG